MIFTLLLANKVKVNNIITVNIIISIIDFGRLKYVFKIAWDFTYFLELLAYFSIKISWLVFSLISLTDPNISEKES